MGEPLPHLAPTGKGNGSGSGSGSGSKYQQQEEWGELGRFTDAQVAEFREQDRWLPIANVARIMKNSLPPTAKVSKDAKECVQECVSEFISFITSEAADKCLNEKRKTINGEDILTSMRALGFDNYERVLTIYLAKYRNLQQAKAKHDEDDEDGRKPPGKRKRQTSDDSSDE